MRTLRLALCLLGIIAAAVSLSSPVHADNCYERCSYALGGDTATDETIYEGCLNQCRNSQQPRAPVWFAALAVSESDMRAGAAHGQSSRSAAEQLALQICQRNGGKRCQSVNSGDGLCFGLAMSTHQNIYGQDFDANRSRAGTKAMGRCRGAGADDCWVVAVPCAGDDPRWPSPLPLPPAVAGSAPVDPRTLGTWKLLINPGYWYWQIGPHGTFQSHSEAMDGAPSQAGTFAAADGHWSMTAGNGTRDTGTYTFQSPDIWVVTGHLGTGTWRRTSEQQ